MATYSMFNRWSYKRAFIDKFGADRWTADHEGSWVNSIDPATGRTETNAVLPDMPVDVFQWLQSTETPWGVGIWANVAHKMTTDAGSMAQLTAKSFQADTANAGQAIKDTAQGVAKTSSKFALGAVCVFGATLAVIFRDDVKAAFAGGKKATE